MHYRSCLMIINVSQKMKNYFYKISNGTVTCAIQLRQNIRSFLGLTGIVWLSVLLLGIVYATLDMSIPFSNYEYSFSRVLTTILWTPILEELIFRVMLFRLSLKWLSVISSALLSSFLFGLCHYPSVIGHTFAGFYFVTILIKTNSLLVCIILHSINNILVVALGFLVDHYWIVEDTFIDTIVLTTVIAILFLLFVFGRRDLVELFKSVWHKERMMLTYPYFCNKNGIKTQCKDH